MTFTPHLIPVEAIRLLVFDLDGTLIDSRRDLANSVNAMLGHLDRPALPEDVIASYIGDGAGMLVRRALGDPEDETYVERALKFFLDYYREHKLDYTHVYPGVLESLEALQSGADGSGRQMAVLTNKPVGPSQAICEALRLSPYFFRIYGGNSFSTKKPDPQGLKALIQEAGVDPFETVMVGDSDIDILTARSAGAWALACRFGLSPHTLDAADPDCFVDSPWDWTDALSATGITR
ncbi:Phosphoglycolate phosphatase [Acidisarcina polymorpha]|uniref:phosphoglycolate phosphatase n=1 Tax=Acidisarcina polymorpha TaxID=2211140 RepID=A0A2Z5FT01_9BACT|nr:HAD-IA family hydrolase [Acidisarcina polymorpha]AXC09606.1 Phosphoglycolate phosphatase [Acidisarcina polymorpha]